MTCKIVSSNVKGISYREHATRKHGKQKDKYFIIRYSANKKQITEAVGWMSEGWTLQKVNEILCEIKRNIREGKHPQSLAEKREIAEKAKREQEIEEIETVSERVTLRDIFDKYLKVHKTETSEATWKNTERYYFNWIDKELGTKKLVDITVDDIRSIITQALEKRTTRTADFIKTVFRQIFNFAKKSDLYFKDNPAMKIKIKNKDNKRSRFLTKDEARLLLDELQKRSIDVHDIALISLYGGFRAGEIFNLQWEHIVWHSERIIVVDTKNSDSRIEPMHPLVKQMLQRRYSNSQTGYIFQNRDGEKIKDLSNTFQRTVDKLGFNDGITDTRQKVVFHTLRHTYASWLVMNGVDLYTTQKLMGHKTNQMTQRYAHLAPGYLEKAVNSLESI